MKILPRLGKRRENVLRILEKPSASYSQKEGIQVNYVGENLSVKAYFMSCESACAFQNAMNQWEVNLDREMPDPRDSLRLRLQDYKPNESESPCQSVEDSHSYHISVPETEAVHAASDMARYQSIDWQVPHLNHYKCHLKDKAKFKILPRKRKQHGGGVLAVSSTTGWPGCP